MLKLLIARRLEFMEGGHCESRGKGGGVSQSCFLGMRGNEVG